MRRAYQNLSQEDRQIRERLDRASRELEEALRVLDTLRGGQALRTRREVTALYRGLREVGKARSVVSDPDLVPENERNTRHREKLAAERKRKGKGEK